MVVRVFAKAIVEREREKEVATETRI